MKNIYVLPTDKASRLYLTTKEYSLSTDECQNKNIYITSDEEIKEGDIVKIPCGAGKVKELHWKYGNDFPSYVVEDIFTYKLRYGQKENELQTNSFKYGNVKKIILTTDQDLIKDGVQAIDDEFLEWFVKNPTCKEVKVILSDVSFVIQDTIYKIIIPKEEPKQETLEEAAENYIKELDVQHYISQEDFILGAKWQAERIYSEEDINKLLDTLLQNNMCSVAGDELIKQFKKK